MPPDTNLRILFVCTANVCRSPLAAALARQHAWSSGAAISMASASVDSQERVVHPMIVQLLAEHEVTLDPTTTSIALSPELVTEADLILTMTGDHAITVAGRFRDVAEKVFMIDHLAQLARASDAHLPLDQFLSKVRLQARRYPNHPTAQDVPDPIGHDEATFRRVGDQLDLLTQSMVSRLHAMANH